MRLKRNGKKFFCAGILLLMTMLAVGTVVFAAGGSDSYGPTGDNPNPQNPSITIVKENVNLPNGASQYFTFEVEAITEVINWDSGTQEYTKEEQIIGQYTVVVDSTDPNGRTVGLPSDTNEIKVKEISSTVDGKPVISTDGYKISADYKWNRTVAFNNFDGEITVAGPNSLTITLNIDDRETDPNLKYTFLVYSNETGHEEEVILDKDKNSDTILLDEGTYLISLPYMDPFAVLSSFLNSKYSAWGNGNTSASTESFANSYNPIDNNVNFNNSPFIRIYKIDGKPNKTYCYEICDSSGNLITPSSDGISCYKPRIPTLQSNEDNYTPYSIDEDHFIVTTDENGNGGLLITGLDYASETYTVRELDNAFYESGTIVVSSSSDAETAVIPIAKGAQISFKATNTFTETDPEYGRLTVSKTVKGEDANPNDEFKFRITLLGEDGSPTNEYDHDWITHRMSFSNGAFEFTLKDGESATAINLPNGLKYKVEEFDANGYPTTSYVTTVNQEAGSSQTGTEATGDIVLGETIVAFTNSTDDEEESQTGSYKYVHEYYLKNADGSLTFEGRSDISSSGTITLPDSTHYDQSNVTKVYEYDGKTYKYTDDAYGTTSGSSYHESDGKTYVVATEDGTEIIILKYVREVTPEPTPTPPPSKPSAGSYKYVHEYYLQNPDGSLTFEGRSDISSSGTITLPDSTHYDQSDVTKVYEYGGKTYTYTDDAYGTTSGSSYRESDGKTYVTATTSGNQIIILKYVRNLTGSYHVVHEYYLKNPDGSLTFEGRSDIDDNDAPLDDTRYTESGVTRKPDFDGKTYTYEESAYGKVTSDKENPYAPEDAMEYVVSTLDGEEIVILRYIRTLTGSYHIVHEYYLKNNDGSLTLEGKSGIDDVDAPLDNTQYTESGVTRKPVFDGRTYTYDNAAYGKMTRDEENPYAPEDAMEYVLSTQDGEEIIILRYIRTLPSGNHDPDPEPTPTPKPDNGFYHIVHEYYLQNPDGSLTLEGTSDVDSVSAPLDDTRYTESSVTRKPNFNGRTYTYVEDAYGKMTRVLDISYAPEDAMEYVVSTPDGEEIIILRYVRSTTDEDRPHELPDPNDPDSPDEFILWDDDVPTTYLKLWDPEEEEWFWLPEDEIPLINMELPDDESQTTEDDESQPSEQSDSNTPATGDASKTALWAALAVAALGGICALVLPRKKTKQ